jgi:hypothetical protein
MSLFSDIVTVTGAAAGILLLLALAVTPLLGDRRAPRRRSLPRDAVGTLPATATPEPVAVPEPAAPSQGSTTVAVRELRLALPVQRTAVAIAIPGQRPATHLS